MSPKEVTAIPSLPRPRDWPRSAAEEVGTALAQPPCHSERSPATAGRSEESQSSNEPPRGAVGQGSQESALRGRVRLQADFKKQQSFLARQRHHFGDVDVGLGQLERGPAQVE